MVLDMNLNVLISIHAPREGSDIMQITQPEEMTISIHAPREGSDISSGNIASRSSAFQSTLPVRGATKKNNFNFIMTLISIHAPREGSD